MVKTFFCCFEHYVSSTCHFLLGEEVALYCSKYLPDIIKEQKTYKDGKLQKVMLCLDPVLNTALNHFLLTLYFFCVLFQGS